MTRYDNFLLKPLHNSIRKRVIARILINLAKKKHEQTLNLSYQRR